MQQITTIQIKKRTRKRLHAHGAKGESYDKIIDRILDAYEKK